MKSASIAQIKKELQNIPVAELNEICIRLMKYKKENKELVTYLLYESQHEALFIKDLKIEVDQLFTEVNVSSLFWAKKSIRKILRFVHKHCKYSGLSTTWIEMLIYFCEQMKQLPLSYHQSTALVNLYQSQIRKIEQYVGSLHEDLQFDYQEKITELKNSLL